MVAHVLTQRRRRWANDAEPVIGKIFRKFSCTLGVIKALWAQYHCRSSIGRWSSGASPAAVVGAISLVFV